MKLLSPSDTIAAAKIKYANHFKRGQAYEKHLFSFYSIRHGWLTFGFYSPFYKKIKKVEYKNQQLLFILLKKKTDAIFI